MAAVNNCARCRQRSAAPSTRGSPPKRTRLRFNIGRPPRVRQAFIIQPRQEGWLARCHELEKL